MLNVTIHTQPNHHSYYPGQNPAHPTCKNLSMMYVSLRASVEEHFPQAYPKQGGPPSLNLEHQSKWVGFDVIIKLKAHEYHYLLGESQPHNR